MLLDAYVIGNEKIENIKNILEIIDIEVKKWD